MDDTDGWNHVERKKGRKPALNTNRPSRPPPSKDIDAEKVAADFKRKTRIWQQSDCRRQVLQILDRQKPDDGWQIKTAVCMGSGSFSRDNMEHCKRSMFQFAVFMDTVRQLQDSSDATIEIFAQEPVYTTIDLDFLRLQGVTACKTPPGIMPPAEELVRNGPDAMDLFREDTFVCEMFMERNPAFIQRLLQAQVGLIMGSMAANRNRPRQNGARLDNDDLAKAEDTFKEEYQSYRVPRFDDDPNVLEGLFISNRLETEEDDN